MRSFGGGGGGGGKVSETVEEDRLRGYDDDNDRLVWRNDGSVSTRPWTLTKYPLPCPT